MCPVPAPFEDDSTPAPVTGNALFDDERVIRWPLDGWMLDPDTSIVLVHTPEDLERAQGWIEDGNVVWPFLYRPGTPVPNRVVAAIERVLGWQWGCTSSHLAGHWGYPPLPQATITDPGGRVTKHVNPLIPTRYLGHPIFWLPEEVLLPVAQGPRGSAPLVQDAEIVRLGLELASRGVLDLDTGDFVDVLVANQLDYRDPDVAASLDALCRSERVPELDELILPDPPSPGSGPGVGLWAATEGVDFVREHLEVLGAAEATDANDQVGVAIEMMRLSTLEKGMAPFEEGGAEWFQSQRTERDNERLATDAWGVLGEIREVLVSDCMACLPFEVLRAQGLLTYGAFDDPEEGPARLDRYHLSVDEQTAPVDGLPPTWGEELEPLLAALFAESDRTRREPLDALWNYLADEWRRWVWNETGTALCQETVSRWEAAGPMRGEEWTIVPPDPLRLSGPPALAAGPAA